MERHPKKLPTPQHHGFLQDVADTVQRNQDCTFASWYDNTGKLTDERTFGEIWETAGKIAHYLRREWKVEHGQRVILCYDFGLHFFEVFFGCLRAGVTAVLVYPPGPPLQKSLTKLSKVVSDCEPALILTDTRISRARMLDKSNPMSKTRHLWPDGVEYKVTDNLFRKAVLSFDEPSNPSDLAFLQYTSGSTGDPKGVMVTFGALQCNVDVERSNVLARHDSGEKPILFSWLPQYHDLGLIGFGIAPFADGWRLHMMSPISFIQKPLLWLDLMSRHRVQWTAAPDFAYQLVVRKYKQAQQALKSKSKDPIPGLNLSHLRNTVSAAEPCRPETYTKFSETFSPYGLPNDWYISAYGLAEQVVFVSFGLGMQLSTPREEDCGKQYVACGEVARLHPSILFKIVDPETGLEVGEGETGELWLAGKSVTAGYFNKPGLSESFFKARLPSVPGVDFLRTGDLFFEQTGYLYICGRIKDLIIVNGVNYYPQDIEYVVQDASPAVRPSCVAAFCALEIVDDQSVEVVFEIRQPNVREAKAVAHQVRNAVLQQVGISVGRIIVIQERTIPKTTSGKIQRRATREALQTHKLEVIYVSEQDIEASAPEKAIADKKSIAGAAEKTALADRSARFYDIVQGFLGGHFDPGLTWDELGLSSMSSIELREAVECEFLVTLCPSCFEDFPTPTCLRKFLESQTNKPFPVVMPSLAKARFSQGTSLGWRQSCILQGLGLGLLFLLLALSFIPAYHVGKFVASIPVLGGSAGRVSWQWLPLTIPTWMLSLTVLMIATKWVLIGRYAEVEVGVPSLYFLRWWFVDRLVDVWEQWVGKFIKDTPLLWLVYFCLGANIDFSAKLDAFVREFDLVEVGSHSKVEYPLSCRRFSSWEQDDGLRLRFRRVQIGQLCLVRGLVGLGATVGNGCHVERLSAIPEGAQIPDCTYAKGNPAVDQGEAKARGENNAMSGTPLLALGALKLLGLVAVLYLFFSYLLVGQWVVNDRLPSNFRYTPLLYWVFMLGISTVLCMIVCVCLKWVLIGRKQPGQRRTDVWSIFVDWLVDYKFVLSMHTFAVVGENSKVVNLYLKALGMDIDLQSHVWAATFLPSKVDMISVKRSFVSNAWTDVCPDEATGYQQIKVVDSSVGHSVVLEGGSMIKFAQVPPMSIVGGALRGHTGRTTLDYNWTEAWGVVVGALIVAAAIPGYEVFQWDFGHDTVGFSLTKLALVFFVQTISWSGLYWMLQRALFGSKGQKRQEPAMTGLYEVYMSTTYYLIWAISLLRLAKGTPFINLYLRWLGSDIEGRMLFFAKSSYDFPLLTFRNRTVIDGVVISGHMNDWQGLCFGATVAAGILHPSSVIMASTDLTGSKEFGPLRSFVAPRPPGDASVGSDQTSTSSKEHSFPDHMIREEFIV